MPKKGPSRINLLGDIAAKKLAEERMENSKENREKEGRKEIEDAFNDFKKKRADEIYRHNALVPYESKLPAVKDERRNLPMVINQKSGLPMVIRSEEKLPAVISTKTKSLRTIDNQSKKKKEIEDAYNDFKKKRADEINKPTSLVPYESKLPATIQKDRSLSVMINGKNLPLVFDREQKNLMVLMKEEKLPAVFDSKTKVLRIINRKGAIIAIIPEEKIVQKPQRANQKEVASLKEAELEEKLFGKKFSKKYSIKMPREKLMWTEEISSEKEETYAKKEAEKWPMKPLLEKEEKQAAVKKKSSGKGGFAGALEGMDPELTKNIIYVMIIVIVIAAIAAMF